MAQDTLKELRQEGRQRIMGEGRAMGKVRMEEIFNGKSPPICPEGLIHKNITKLYPESKEVLKLSNKKQFNF